MDSHANLAVLRRAVEHWNRADLDRYLDLKAFR
jgi:hypothetical protein